MNALNRFKKTAAGLIAILSGAVLSLFLLADRGPRVANQIVKDYNIPQSPYSFESTTHVLGWCIFTVALLATTSKWQQKLLGIGFAAILSTSIELGQTYITSIRTTEMSDIESNIKGIGLACVLHALMFLTTKLTKSATQNYKSSFR